MDALSVAAHLREIATYLGLEGDRYRARAYERAARSVEASKGLERLIAENRLTELPQIGPSLARAIEEMATRGTIDLLDRLRARWPRLVVELAQIRAVGPARALGLHAALGPADLDELAEMCRQGRVRGVPGFGAASEARLLAAIERRRQRDQPVALAEARKLADGLAAHLAGDGAVATVAVAGAARRWIEISDRLALVAATLEPDAVARRLESHPLVSSVERAAAAPPAGAAPASDAAPADPGAIRFLARMASGAACELVTAPPERYGTALALATGSGAHIELLRRRAGAAGLVLEEIAAPDEESFHRSLGLPWLPPEVRDGTDEIAIALAGGASAFADLVTPADVAGSVHCHTTYSDGKHSVEEMARAAEALGHSYITITDHSPTAHYAGGLTRERLALQWAEIARVQERVGIRILRGTESDILPDGGLDYPDDVLAGMDVVIASIHERHRLDEDGMTRRLVVAMRQPLFKIWGHALGRLLLTRDPLACRFDEVLDAIADSPAAIEINGDPRRLDLDPERATRARARGCRFVLSSDAHSTGALANFEFAVAMARRARVRKSDVLNALPVDEFLRAVRPAPPG